MRKVLVLPPVLSHQKALMTDRITHLTREIAELQQSLAIPGLPEAARALIQVDLRAKQAELAQLQPAAVGPQVDRPNAERDIYIGTHVTVNNYGTDTPPTAQIAEYLRALGGA